MITAEELRDARIRAGFTSQAALAEALGVSERTVTTWESAGNHVSGRAEAKVRALLWPAPGPLSAYSNYELLSEIGRRLDRASQTGHGGENPANPSGPSDIDSPGPEDFPQAGWGRGPRQR